MVQRNFSKSPSIAVQKWTPWLRAFLIATLVGSGLVSLFVWFLPIDIFKSWAYERAEAGEYKQFEAVGRAEFSCWMVRFLAPAIGVVAFALLRNVPRSAVFLSGVIAGCKHVTAVGGEQTLQLRWKSCGFRGLCVAWGLIALGHSGQALQDAMTNWPYYRFRSGSDVLPNISDSNRDVIRYLREATPPGSRIFVASDQKLYFLCYYLLPRRLYYKVHPDAEFVIAQPFQQRRMAAYQLSEIDSQTLDRIDPDYILEYFEHPDFVDRSRLNEDAAWLSFYRKSHRDQGAEPNFIVRLQRIEKDRPR